MKNLTKKDLELNPNVVTGLSGSGNQPKGNTDASEDPVCTALNECGQSVDSCLCATEYVECTGNQCLNTMKACNESVVCQPTHSGGEQCCAVTVADTCADTDYVCPATDGCETAYGCESTTVVCDASDDCPPLVPTETTNC